MKRVRFWAERGVFLASVLALLATSKPKGWELAATITGPKSPSSPAKALSLSIDASHEPHIHAPSIPSTFAHATEAPCLETFLAGAKMTCLLPPGVDLDGVDLQGSCGGCSGACSPPPGAYAKVTVTEVDASIDGDTRTMPASLPSHGKGYIASRFDVRVSGASFIEAQMTIRARGVATGAPLFDSKKMTCDYTGAPSHASCIFLVDDAPFATVHDVDVSVEATGYDACAAPPCTPPKTFHIDSVTVMP